MGDPPKAFSACRPRRPRGWERPPAPAGCRVGRRGAPHPGRPAVHPRDTVGRILGPGRAVGSPVRTQRGQVPGLGKWPGAGPEFTTTCRPRSPSIEEAVAGATGIPRGYRGASSCSRRSRELLGPGARWCGAVPGRRLVAGRPHPARSRPEAVEPQDHLGRRQCLVVGNGQVDRWPGGEDRGGAGGPGGLGAGPPGRPVAGTGRGGPAAPGHRGRPAALVGPAPASGSTRRPDSAALAVDRHPAFSSRWPRLTTNSPTVRGVSEVSGEVLAALGRSRTRGHVVSRGRSVGALHPAGPRDQDVEGAVERCEAAACSGHPDHRWPPPSCARPAGGVLRRSRPPIAVTALAGPPRSWSAADRTDGGGGGVRHSPGRASSSCRPAGSGA